MNTLGITPKTFRAMPHPYLHGAWSVSGKDAQGRTLHVRDVAGGTCHWHTRGQAADAAERLNERTQ
jgi:hypothetical protein